MLLKIRKIAKIVIVIIGFVATILLAVDGQAVGALVMAGLILVYLYVFK
jgi:hypothetical protein